ncbi:restriction endonuclease subunit S [Vulcanococcus limneticus]|uniref:restriction endonuclease subunit S n=1 Tax=Vulcanococcus limneticus TaxID=2170428 RepID=UPI00398BBF94
MSSDNTHKVADLIALGKLCIGDGYRAKNSELGSAGIPFARAGDINGGFHFKSGDHLPEGDAWKAGNKLSQVGDVVFTSKGTVGRFGYVADSIQKFVYSPRLCFWRSLDRNAIDPGFLFYWVQSKEFYQQYKSVSQKTDMAEYVSLSDQRSMEITLPFPGQQKAIAHILGTLDDKIELNRKTNETLEAMAKALFKSWFVDFDPVRAKAEGRPTGLPAEISDLFPDSFEDSELGEIPSGWKCSPLTDRAIYLSRGISPAYCEEGGVLVLNQKCVRDSRVSFEKARRHDTTRKQVIGRKVRRFDALVNSTGVGTLGRVAMMPICQEEVVVDSHVTVVRGGNEQESFFISSALLNRQTEIEALGEGSTGQTELSRVVLGSMPVIFPLSQLISAYFDFALIIQDKIEKNDQASVALASA